MKTSFFLGNTATMIECNIFEPEEQKNLCKHAHGVFLRELTDVVLMRVALLFALLSYEVVCSWSHRSSVTQLSAFSESFYCVLGLLQMISNYNTPVCYLLDGAWKKIIKRCNTSHQIYFLVLNIVTTTPKVSKMQSSILRNISINQQMIGKMADGCFSLICTRLLCWLWRWIGFTRVIKQTAHPHFIFELSQQICL